MKNLLLWLWQTPQHLLALLLLFVTRARYSRAVEKDGVSTRIYRLKSGRWGISLGLYTILGPDFGIVTEFHELGHSFDSRRMGPFYLIAVGFLSAVKANLIGARMLGRGYEWYYTRWVEARADRQGGVAWFNGRRVLAEWVRDGALFMPGECRLARKWEIA